tara:strand:+ start:64 stop:423 length:360 start_codon:yes stop_codon:yes gene_type:complete
LPSGCHPLCANQFKILVALSDIKNAIDVEQPTIFCAVYCERIQYPVGDLQISAESDRDFVSCARLYLITKEPFPAPLGLYAAKDSCKGSERARCAASAVSGGRLGLQLQSMLHPANGHQ